MGTGPVLYRNTGYYWILQWVLYRTTGYYSGYWPSAVQYYWVLQWVLAQCCTVLLGTKLVLPYSTTGYYSGYY